MRNLLLFSIFFLPVIIWGQNKFVGEYAGLIHIEDTLNYNDQMYLYNKSIKINPDSTFTYFEEENLEAFTISRRESILGAWISRGDTVIFCNRGFGVPKEIKVDYLPEQKFDGIRIVLKNDRGQPVGIESCYADSILSDKKFRSSPCNYYTNAIHLPYKTFSRISIHADPHCIYFRENNILIDLTGIKNRTLIEVTVYSSALELQFNRHKYILRGSILYDTKWNTPEFIKKK